MTIQDTLDSLNKKQSEYGWTVLAHRLKTAFLKNITLELDACIRKQKPLSLSGLNSLVGLVLVTTYVIQIKSIIPYP